MKLEVLDGIGRPLVLAASRVLITGDDGTPLCVAAEWQPGTVKCAHAGEPQFRAVLAGLGIDRTVVVQALPVPPPPAAGS